MAKLIKRILLDKLSLEDLSSQSSPEDSVNPNPDAPSASLPPLSVEYGFEKVSPSGDGSSPTYASVEFSFPAEDFRRVQAWFTGDFTHVTSPESATLKKNMTAAVKGVLDTFVASSLSRNLFPAPFAIGCRYRLFDGSAAEIGSTLALEPVDEAPRLIITSNHVYEKSVQTDVILSCNPGKLMMKIPVPEKSTDFIGIITAVEFFINHPVALYPSDMNVSGVRSVSINGTRERVWHYNSYDSASLTASAYADRDFRIIASIPFSEIAEGKYSELTAMPMDAGALVRFPTLPKLTASSSGSSSQGSANGGFTGTEGWRPYIHVATPPLDLSFPEREKSVTDLYLRGVFQREAAVMTLYGSHHREHWRMIARSRGPYIRGLRRTPYRWLKVEIELPMRRDDFLEALTFKFYN